MRTRIALAAGHVMTIFLRFLVSCCPDVIRSRGVARNQAMTTGKKCLGFDGGGQRPFFVFEKNYPKYSNSLILNISEPV